MKPRMVYTADQVERMMDKQRAEEIAFLMALSRNSRSDAKSARRSKLPNAKRDEHAYAFAALEHAKAAVHVAMRYGSAAKLEEAKGVRDCAQAAFEAAKGGIV